MVISNYGSTTNLCSVYTFVFFQYHKHVLSLHRQKDNKYHFLKSGLGHQIAFPGLRNFDG